MKDEFIEELEAEVTEDVRNFLRNGEIRPQPESEFFSKYFATAKKKRYFFEGEEEILHLISSHGVEIRNDLEYWCDKSNVFGSGKDVKKEIPVLNLNNFAFKDFRDVVEKLKELPSEWTVLQITKKFSLSQITREDEMPEIHLTRFACGDLAERVQPYSVTTEGSSNREENVFKLLQNLRDMRREFYNLGRTNRKLYEAYYKTNSELEIFIKDLESRTFDAFICLFQGRMEDTKLEQQTYTQVEKLISSFCAEEKLVKSPNLLVMDFIYQLTCAAHLLKNKSIFNILKILLGGDKNPANVTRLMLLVENLKMLNLSNSCAVKRAKRNPLILIMDDEFEMVPWEMMTTLQGQRVCRIASLHLLYSLYKYHQPNIQKGFRIIEIDCTYCLINPGGDLQDCEKKMREFLTKRIPWAEVEVGKAPDPKDLLSKMEDCSVYLYCGHGSGTQYLKTKDLKKAFIGGLVLLFGCSSNIPKNRGGRTPPQNLTYTYLSNGCPCVIGCIQDLGSSDADAACQEFLSCVMPAISTQEKTVLEPKEPDVLKALAAGRFACPKFWSKSAFVARGIPCKTVTGSISKSYKCSDSFVLQ